MNDVGGMAKCGNDRLMLNIFLTRLIETKTLKFNEANAAKKVNVLKCMLETTKKTVSKFNFMHRNRGG